MEEKWIDGSIMLPYEYDNGSLVRKDGKVHVSADLETETVLVYQRRRYFLLEMILIEEEGEWSWSNCVAFSPSAPFHWRPLHAPNISDTDLISR